MNREQAGVDPPGGISRGEVARGAGLAGLARSGALIEAVAQPLYIWLFGLAAYGLYVVFWGAVNLLANIVDLSMTSALQRTVPTEDAEEGAHRAVKGALIVALIPAFAIALIVTLNAEAVAGIFSAAPADRAAMPRAVALFVWALPLWTFIEVATSAARARRAFGPEIRLRIFWEQIARILFALSFFALGFATLGMMAAHLCSLALTAILCVPLLARYYDLKLLVRVPLRRAPLSSLIVSGLALLPANLSRRMLIDAPPLALNLMLPGAGGAAAAALFEIARKIATVPLIVRQAFQYVMAPLSSAQARVDRKAIAPLYRFASRVSTALVVPLVGLLIFASLDILSLYRPEALAALPLLYILVASRAVEAVVGPATPIVEMIGHRGLPLLNSLIGLALWAVFAWLLVPLHGPIGMAIAVAAATVATSAAATVELRVSDNLSPFDGKLVHGLGMALLGVAMMALAAEVTGGPVRFLTVLTIWAATSWCALRFGLVRGDREALGGFARRLRLL
ncbi:lipopolysaccharide biosynthesis protein [Sphingosinicella rhizophila]|uniref:Lipopolysaccharide biosynthesis protein n=1 Tax=Sphingosinicella rhizophila TaxID=3050082 RepID=A0ABU3Q576_9SPHN|nr:lipopolysaccharide biosynthesis protein [Sphingosinicella sp. GR2756]MDT9598566.1 lipopolysaccharide biosynthesis protein [Sphingosinicella sp. GR2756]